MSQITDIKEQINDLVTFKHIASAFTEASAVKLANIRHAFARNDRFFTEITHIYHLVKANSQKEEAATRKVTQEVKVARNLCVALTSNQRFFGTLNNGIMQRLLYFSKKNNASILVIGVTGQSYMRASNYKEKYQSIIFKSDNPTTEEIRTFLDSISGFNQITIFFPKFLTIVRQEVGTVDMTGKILEGKESKEAGAIEELNILFEPELSKILKFFETEVRMILFKRVLLETELARTAARLLEMSQAEERTDYEIRTKKTELRKVTSSLTNARLLETFSGMKKWKHSISEWEMLVKMKNKLLFK